MPSGKDRVNLAVRWLLGVLLVVAVIDQLMRAPGWGHDSWRISEWLIHYGDGFVRRGLAGTVFRWGGEVTGIPANLLAIGVSLGLYLLLAGWLFHRGRETFAAGLLLSCVVLGFPAYQDAIVRKDCLGLLLFVGCLGWMDRCEPPVVRWVGVNLLACTALLIHETFAFFGLPALVLFGVPDSMDGKGLATRTLALGPAWVVFALTAVFHGSPHTAHAIHESWLPLWREIEGPAADLSEPAAAIAALGWEPQEGMALVKGIWGAGPYQPLAWAMVFGVSLLLVLAFTRSERRGRLFGIMAVQWVGIAPLFVLGIDYGRWLFLWVVSAMILHLHGRRLPVAVESRIASWVRVPFVERSMNHLGRHEWVFLFFGVPVLWSLRNFLTAGPIPHHGWSWFGPF